MPRLLHLETATEICSVALSENGRLLALLEERSPNSHSATITLLIQKLFADAGMPMSRIDAVAVSAGPGSFTGLRIGASVAKGLCYALGKPLIAVPTTLAMAAGALQKVHEQTALYCPVLDSVKQEVYAALYDAALREMVPPSPSDNLLSALQQHFFGKNVFFFGTGVKKLPLPPCRDGVVLADFCNSAAHLLAPAEAFFAEKQFAPVEYFEPLYVKTFIPR